MLLFALHMYVNLLFVRFKLSNTWYSFNVHVEQIFFNHLLVVNEYFSEKVCSTFQEANKRNNNWLPPPWAIVALVVLGFNEFMTLLRYTVFNFSGYLNSFMFYL